MAELLHKGGDIIGFPPHMDSIQFPVLTFHFPQEELSNSAFVVAPETKEYIGDLLSKGLTKSLHHAKAVVFGGYDLKSAVLLQRTTEGVVGMRQEEQGDGSKTVTSWQYRKEPLITTRFDENSRLHVSILDPEDQSSQGVEIDAKSDEGLMVFTGRFAHELENRYEHIGGNSSISVVDKHRSDQQYGAVVDLIRETEESRKKGETRRTYYEFVSEGGGRIVYREIRPESTTVHKDSHLTHVKRWLLPSDNWIFVPHH